MKSIQLHGHVRALTLILKHPYWPPVLYHIHFRILVPTLCALQVQVHVYISELLKMYSASQSLRSSGRNLLMVSCTCFKLKEIGSLELLQLNS